MLNSIKELDDMSVEDVRKLTFKEAKQIHNNIGVYLSTAENDGNSSLIEKLNIISELEPNDDNTNVNRESNNPGNPGHDGGNIKSTEDGGNIKVPDQVINSAGDMINLFKNSIEYKKQRKSYNAKMFESAPRILRKLDLFAHLNGFAIKITNRFKSSMDNSSYHSQKELFEDHLILVFVQYLTPRREVLSDFDQNQVIGINKNRISEGNEQSIKQLPYKINPTLQTFYVLTQNISSFSTLFSGDMIITMLLHKIIGIEKTINVIGSCSDISVTNAKLFSASDNIIPINIRNIKDVKYIETLTNRPNNIVIFGLGKNLLPAMIFAKLCRGTNFSNIIRQGTFYIPKYLNVNYDAVCMNEPIYIITDDVVKFNSILANYQFVELIKTNVLQNVKNFIYTHLGGEKAVAIYNQVNEFFEFYFNDDQIFLPKLRLPKVIGYWNYGFNRNNETKSNIERDIIAINNTLQLGKVLNDLAREKIHNTYAGTFEVDYAQEKIEMKSALNDIKSSFAQNVQDSHGLDCALIFNNFIRPLYDNWLTYGNIVEVVNRDKYLSDAIYKGNFFPSTILPYAKSDNYLGWNNGQITLNIDESHELGISTKEWSTHLFITEIYDGNDPYNGTKAIQPSDQIYINRNDQTFRGFGRTNTLKKGDVKMHITNVACVVSSTFEDDVFDAGFYTLLDLTDDREKETKKVNESLIVANDKYREAQLIADANKISIPQITPLEQVEAAEVIEDFAKEVIQELKANRGSDRDVEVSSKREITYIEDFEKTIKMDVEPITNVKKSDIRPIKFRRERGFDKRYNFSNGNIAEKSMLNYKLANELLGKLDNNGSTRDIIEIVDKIPINNLLEKTSSVSGIPKRYIIYKTLLHILISNNYGNVDKDTKNQINKFYDIAFDNITGDYYRIKNEIGCIYEAAKPIDKLILRLMYQYCNRFFN